MAPAFRIPRLHMSIPNVLTTLDMASRRSLRGGRVLGSGRNLSPAVSPRPPRQHCHNASFLSPSESSVLLSSQTSISPASTAETKEDVGSRVLAGPSENAAASASSRLVCPICNLSPQMPPRVANESAPLKSALFWTLCRGFSSADQR